MHILWYAMGNMQRVVLHSTFPSLLARNIYAGVLLKTFQNQLRCFLTPANASEQFRSLPQIFRWFPKTYEENYFEPLPKLSESLLNISEDFFEIFP